MRVVIMRHGEAQMSAGGDRVLSDAGRRQCAHTAEALCSYLDAGLLWCSDKTRAHQTAEIVARSCGGLGTPECTSDLRPSADHMVIAQRVRELARSGQTGALVMVSHLPLVDYLASELTGHSRLPFGPADALVFDIDSQGTATTVANLTPHVS